MSLRADITQLHPGALVASKYAGHGAYGATLVNGGTNGPSHINTATTVSPFKEYRLTVVSLPAGVMINEDGSGQAVTPGGRGVFKVFEDGIEL